MWLQPGGDWQGSLGQRGSGSKEVDTRKGENPVGSNTVRGPCRERTFWAAGWGAANPLPSFQRGIQGFKRAPPGPGRTMPRGDPADFLPGRTSRRQLPKSARIVSADALQCRAFAYPLGLQWEHSPSEGTGSVPLEPTPDFPRDVSFFSIGCR